MKLKIVEFNVENLFLFLDLFRGKAEDFLTMSEETWQQQHSYPVPMKSLQKVLAIAQVIHFLNADIIVFCEVGGKVSLDHFNQYFLHQTSPGYDVYHLPSNSDRGIDLGYLVKKNLPFTFELTSHRERVLAPAYAYPCPSALQTVGLKFSRDVLQLSLTQKNETKPALILLAVHLKSKLDKEMQDPKGRYQRSCEVQTLVDLAYEVSQSYQHQVPFILIGDFNGHAGERYPDPEFAPLYHYHPPHSNNHQDLNFRDALQLAQKNQDERITHLYFHPAGMIEKNQLDYIFLSSHLHQKLVSGETYVFKFSDPPLYQRYPPQNKFELYTLPSDHCPVVLSLDL